MQVDTDRSSVEEIIASLEQQGITVRRNEQVERALFLSGYEALDEIEEFENGLLYVQDTASMLAVELAAPKQGDHVIDVCAAPVNIFLDHFYFIFRQISGFQHDGESVGCQSV